MIGLLAANGDVPDPAKVLEAVLDREATRTTGIGYGLAIPHGRTAGASQLTMAIGRCENPIEFQAIDGRPVSIVWLLVSPPDKSVAHIATLARITKLMMVDKFRVEMNRATSAQELFDLIAKQEAAMADAAGLDVRCQLIEATTPPAVSPPNVEALRESLRASAYCGDC